MSITSTLMLWVAHIWFAASVSGLWVRKLQILALFCNCSVVSLLAMRVTSCFSSRLLRNTIAGLVVACPLRFIGSSPTPASNLLLSLLILVKPNSFTIVQTKTLCATSLWLTGPGQVELWGKNGKMVNPNKISNCCINHVRTQGQCQVLNISLLLKIVLLHSNLTAALGVPRSPWPIWALQDYLELMFGFFIKII